MNCLKKFLDMLGDSRYTCPIIALSCVPLTIYNVIFVSPSAGWSLVMVALNVLMLLIAMGDDGE